MIRCQLPAYSPLSPGRLVGAAWRAATAQADARATLTALLREQFQAQEVLLTDSGTHALQRALALATSAGAWKHRSVALPAYSCYDVVTAAVGADVSVVFYDVEPSSLAPDRQSVREVLANGAGVFVANSLYGFPIDWTWLRHECETAGALLIEDAAQGLGSGWDGRLNAAFGDLTVLSFGRGKGWTGGGGGALLARTRYLTASGYDLTLRGSEERTAGLVSNVRAFGVSMAQWALGRPWLYWIPASIPALALGTTLYKEPTAVGMMPAFSAAAAAGIADLARSEVPIRRAVAAVWQAGLIANLGDFPRVAAVPSPVEGGDCGYLRLPVLARDSASRASLVREGRSLGVAPGYPRALPALPAAAKLGARETSTPGARALAERLFTLPTHSRVGDRDRQLTDSLLRKAAE